MKTLHFLVIICLVIFSTSGSAIEKITFYHNDAAGSPVAATDDSGNLLWDQAYDAWGVPIPSASGDSRGFTGASRDSDTGLSDLQARWYSPGLGRMLAMDPVNFHEGNIQSFNLYAYGNNNPYRYHDPNGESPIEVFTDAAPAFGESLGAWGALIIGRATNDWGLYYAGQEGLRDLQATNIAAVASVASPPGIGLAARATAKSDKYTDLISSSQKPRMRLQDVSDRGAKERNFDVDWTMDQFGKHLLDNGFSVDTRNSKDGPIYIFSKGGKKHYTTRGFSDSTGGPTGEVFRDSIKVGKIRFKKEG